MFISSQSRLFVVRILCIIMASCSPLLLLTLIPQAEAKPISRIITKAEMTELKTIKAVVVDLEPMVVESNEVAELPAAIEMLSSHSESDYSNNFIIYTKDGTKIYYMAIMGDGTFGDEILIHTANSGQKFYGFAIADYDLDGDNDFVTFDDPDGALKSDLYLFEQTNLGTFEESIVFTDSLLNESGFVAADFNGDNYYDLAGYKGGKTGVIYLNDRNGSFTEEDTFPYTSATVSKGFVPQYSAGDIDNDGDVDIMLGSYSDNGSGEIYLFENDGAGIFSDYSTLDATVPQAGPATIVGFFGGDRNLDVIAGQDDDNDPGQAWIYFGDGSGSFTTSDTESYDTESAIESGTDQLGQGRGKPFDVNSDGIVDLIVATQNTHSPARWKITYWLGNGDGTFQEGGDLASNLGHFHRYDVSPVSMNLMCHNKVTQLLHIDSV
ncbi:MAG TPA: VCBS repeat-containing protein [Anaerolineae bacterium]|nr:VCBS repeat-containing protein [Anaerolineae bacterium]